jgi:hypothetical protein
VLRVISSSPGDLEPVFTAMLANAVRICEAKFGTLYTYDGNGFHAAAFHNAPPAFVEARKREPVIHPPPDTPLGRVASTRSRKSPTSRRRGHTLRAIHSSLPLPSWLAIGR